MDQEAILAMLHDLSTRIDEAPRKVKPDQTVSVTNRTSSKQSEVLSPYWSCEREATAGGVTLTYPVTTENWDDEWTASTASKIAYSISTGDGSLDLPNWQPFSQRAELVFQNPGAPFNVTFAIESYEPSGSAGRVQYILNGVATTITGPNSTTVTWQVNTGRNRIAIVVARNTPNSLNHIALKGKFLVSNRTTWVKDNK